MWYNTKQKERYANNVPEYWTDDDGSKCFKIGDLQACIKVVLPMPYFAASDWQMGYNKTDSISTFKGDACKECCKRIAKAIELSCKKYGEYAYAGKFIGWKE